MEVHLPAAATSAVPHDLVAALPETTGRLRKVLVHVAQQLTSICAVYTWCTIFLSLGGFVFGYDTGSIGPVTVMPQFESHFEHLQPAKHGLIVSSILLTASVFSLVAGPLADRISRTYTISLGGLIFATGSALCLGAPPGSLGMFIAGRCVAGAGEGLFMTPITTYTCEIAPTHIRGRLSVTVQLFITLGIAAGYFTCYGSVEAAGSAAWRAPYIVQVCVASLLAAGALLLPHSPRWLKHVGRVREADAAWTRLGVSLAEAEKEEQQNQQQEQQQQNRDLARTAMSNASGIDGVLYYAPLLFSQAGLSSTTAAFLASGVTGVVNVAVTIPTLIYSDTWGRRPSLIRGGIGIASTMLLIGTLYASHATDAQAGRIAVIVMIFLFLISFAMSWAVVVRVYSSEIQPMRTRAAATALSQAANWIINWLIAFSTPLFLARSSSGPYFLFGGCSLATVVVCYFFSPESRGISLEDLDKAFEGRPWEPPFARRAGGEDTRDADAIELNELPPWRENARFEHLVIADRLIALPDMFTHCAKPGWVDRAQFIQWHNESIKNEPTARLFAVFSATTSPPSPAGLIGLLHADAVNECAELGFVYVLPEWQRTHVLTNAAGLLIRYCMDDLKLRRLSWRSSTENPASIRAAERLGFKLEGITRWCRVMDEGQEAGHRRGDEDFVYPLKDLHNDRVRLELFDSERPEHLAVIDQMLSHPELHKHFPRQSWTERAHFDAWYAERVGSTPTACLFAVFSLSEPAPPSPAGLIGLLHTEKANECAELGFVYVLPVWQRTHVLTNAAGLLMHYCMDDLRMRRLYWLASTENAASMRAAERLGFKFEGIMRWYCIAAEGKTDGHRRGDEKKLGLHVATLAVCWDDWETGDVKEALNKQMARQV
ncbi:hypothetical protein AURDEDRAFT_186068 [Auricularia subglabra TFB-10046 SS5]|nr:hypothetical protein AURDEDRAFT_186068 [Auricularia subglabra TFB-10046 SS5]